VSRAFSFSQDTPNKIKKTISSVFRSPFQTSYSQQSLNEQKSSKLASLASLQLTPTLVETKRKLSSLSQKSRELHTQSSQLFMRNSHHHSHHHHPESITQTTSSLLSLDTCGLMMSNMQENNLMHHAADKTIGSSSSLDSTNSHNKLAEALLDGEHQQPSSHRKPPLMQHLPDVTNIVHSNSFKRQLS
jgi:hypothetical protein